MSGFDRYAAPLADRRQRAREAAHDVWSDTDGAARIEAAIEIATQVKITGDILDAVADALTDEGNPADYFREMTTAAFRAAGFEVIE